MNAAILAVGSELLGADRSDTNSLRLTAVLRRHGVTLVGKSVTGDSVEDVAAEVNHWREKIDLLVVSGGLGPTSDDVTREGVALALGRSLRHDDRIEAQLRRRFEDFGLAMATVNLRQAMVIEGAEVLANPRGSAPGQLLREGGRLLFLLPGVPSEFDGMIRSHLEPLLTANGSGEEMETATLRAACVAESTLEERIAPAYEEFDRESISILASPGDVRIQVTAIGAPEDRRRRLTATCDRLAELVGDAIYTRRANESLEAVLARLLRTAGQTLATAESCTGGLVAKRLTAVAGSSDYFVGGTVAYANRIKEEMLAVPESLIAAHGAVSEEVARAMAEGARKAFQSDLAVAVTGVAGPDGGTDDKPVGRVHLAVCDVGGSYHRRLTLPGIRRQVRWNASQWALDMLRRRLLHGVAMKSGGGA